MTLKLEWIAGLKMEVTGHQNLFTEQNNNVTVCALAIRTIYM